MKNKWLFLAMVFVFGFLALPVFAGPAIGDGIYIGAASEPTMTSTAQPFAATQLGTVMETLLAVTLILIVFSPLLLMATGPTSTAPERHDKSVVSGPFGNLRKLSATAMNSGRFKRQVS